jgi:hypothetical protein
MAERHDGQIECKRCRCHLRHGAHASRILSDHHASNSLMTRTCRAIISGCESEQVAHCGVHAPRAPPTWAECDILSYRGGCVGRSRPSGCKALSLLHPCSLQKYSSSCSTTLRALRTMFITTVGESVDKSVKRKPNRQ